MESKATAVLMRLREIDKKYKSRYGNNNNSSDSDSDNDDDNDTFDIKKSNENKPLELYRPQLNIKIPDIDDEYLDTNSSNNNTNDRSLSVRIINANDCDKISNTSTKTSVTSHKNDNSLVKSINEHDNLNNRKMNEGKLDLINEQMYNQELSISENLDIIEKSTTAESDESIGEKMKSMISDSTIKSSINKYSDDSFESNSSRGTKSEMILTPILSETSLLPSPSSLSLLSKKSETIKNAEYFVDNNLKNFSEEIENKNDNNISSKNDTKIIESSNNYTQLSPEVSDDTYKVEQTKDQQVTEQISVVLSNNLSIDENNMTPNKTQNSSSKTYTEDDNEKIIKKNFSKSSNLQEHSTVTSEISKTSIHNSIIKKTKNKCCKLNDTDKKIKNKKCTKERSKERGKEIKYLEHVKGEFDTDRKVLERKMRRDHIRFRREHERIHSTLIYYLEEMKEERKRFHLLWPKCLIYPEKVNVDKIIKPLNFPYISGFIRPPDDLTIRNSKTEFDILRNRLLDIRQWMKDQYMIYKEHCDVADALNKTYTGISTIEETKRVSE